MGKAQELQLPVTVHEAVHGEENSVEDEDVTNQSTTTTKPKPRSFNWWIKMVIYTICILCGQSVATVLGNLYFDKGGKSKWLATLVQLCGFPILLPYYFLSKPKLSSTKGPTQGHPPSLLVLSSVYITVGLILAADCMFYSIGLQYLPVSTYSLISVSGLAFNALFSIFLNSLKLTPYIINSLVLLTTSSILLVFQSDSEKPDGVSKGQYIIGFVCTLVASAGYGLVLSLTQLSFTKVIKNHSFKAVMDMIIYQQLVATLAVLVGLLASGEGKGLRQEMEGYELGKLSYVMNLTWTAIGWQVWSIGSVGLIFEVSSLFSNAITVVGTPVVPVLAVFIFHDKMDGVKVVAMVLGVWGIVSYVYQHYLEDQKLKCVDRDVDEDPKLHSIERCS